jgi:hypothetical protein
MIAVRQRRGGKPTANTRNRRQCEDDDEKEFLVSALAGRIGFVGYGPHFEFRTYSSN